MALRSRQRTKLSSSNRESSAGRFVGKPIPWPDGLLSKDRCRGRRRQPRSRNSGHAKVDEHSFQLFGSQGWKQNTAPDRSQMWQRPSAALLMILLGGTTMKPLGPGLIRARHRPSSPIYAVVVGRRSWIVRRHRVTAWVAERRAVASPCTCGGIVHATSTVRTGLRHCHVTAMAPSASAKMNKKLEHTCA